VILATPVKGVVKLYDPFNFDVFMAPEYGGFAEAVANNNSNSRKMPRGPTGSARRQPMDVMPGPRAGWEMRGPPMPPPPPDWGRPGPGIGNHYDDRRGHIPQMYPRWPVHENGGHRGAMPPPNGDPVPYWSDAIPQPDSNSSVPPNPHPPGMHGWVNPHFAMPSNLAENPDGSASASLTVPNNVAGAIIGKGGNRIRVVRRDSGADISISSSGNGNDRIVLIKGTQDQVRMAYSMLQRSIAENSR